MSTVSDLIKDSLKLIGAIASGASPSSAESADALRALNRMLGTWSNDGLMIYERSRESFPLVASQASYTFGLTGEFNSSRPMLIESAAVLRDGSEYAVTIINNQEWASISQKSTRSSFPTKLYVEGSYPLATLSLWPVPSEVNNLILYTKKPLAQFASVNDVVSLPPGYEDAIVNNLAVRLAPEFGKPLDPLIMAFADKSLASIKRKNIKPVYMKSDTSGMASGGHSFNVITGE